MTPNRNNRKALPGSRKRGPEAQEQARQAGKLGGRPKGVPNAPREARGDMRDIARKYGPEALDALINIAKHGAPDGARVSAIREILDRGYGKAPQPMDGDGDGGPIQLAIRWLAPAG